MRSVGVDVVFDVICPWCYLGKRRLELAAALVPSVTVTVRWIPFFLEPDLPAEGVDYRAHMIARFGDAARLDRVNARIAALGEEDGIAFQFDRMKRIPNTLDAHRMIRWAAVEGRANALVEALQALYFCRGADISKRETLLRAAREAGLDPVVIGMLLDGEADREAVLAEAEEARRRGVTGVPTLIVAGRHALVGVQEAEEIASLLNQVASAG